MKILLSDLGKTIFIGRDNGRKARRVLTDNKSDNVIDFVISHDMIINSTFLYGFFEQELKMYKNMDEFEDHVTITSQQNPYDTARTKWLLLLLHQNYIERGMQNG